jgi:hypothetical protein
MNTIALFGAAGRIGARIADKLKNDKIGKNFEEGIFCLTCEDGVW